MSDTQHGDDSVLHEDAIEGVVDERLDGVTTENVALPNLNAITGGEAPTEAEYNLVVTKVNAILAALRSSGIIPAA